MTYLFVQPTDVWLFRTGHPFNAGETDYARSLFPPSPLTVQGALRSATALSGKFDDTKLKDLIGLPGCAETGKFGLGAITMGRSSEDTTQVEQFIPVPNDVTWSKAPENRGPLEYLRPDENANGHISGLPVKPLNVKLGTEGVHGWFDSQAFDDYLQGNHLASENVTSSDETQQPFFTSEYRFGIGIDYVQGTTNRDDGELYYVQFIRMSPNAGLLVEVDDEFANESAFPDRGRFPMGGEQHIASYRKVQIRRYDWHQISSRQFKVVFLSPTYFENGWEPSHWSKFFDGQVELVSAAVSRPQLIGGWDSAIPGPLPMYRYVPAGSVYYFRGDATLKTSAITENPENIDAASLGFGQFAIGRWED